jgi:hypothetical protein
VFVNPVRRELTACHDWSCARQPVRVRPSGSPFSPRRQNSNVGVWSVCSLLRLVRSVPSVVISSCGWSLASEQPLAVGRMGESPERRRREHQRPGVDACPEHRERSDRPRSADKRAAARFCGTVLSGGFVFLAHPQRGGFRIELSSPHTGLVPHLGAPAPESHTYPAVAAQRPQNRQRSAVRGRRDDRARETRARWFDE